MTTYRVVYVSPEVLAETAEGAHQKSGGLTPADLTSYLGKSSRTADNAIISATQLKIIVSDSNKLKVTPDGTDLAKASIQQRPNVFKKFLVRYDPFVVFAMLLIKKNTLADAARKVKVIYDIPEPEQTILEAFRSWGIYSQIIDKTKSDEYMIHMTEDKLQDQYLHDLLQAVQNEWTARLFISSKVREYAYAYLGDDEKTQLVESLIKFRTDSDKAIQQLGKSFETFLKRLAKDRGIDVSKANGISQLASHLKGGNVIMEQHRKLSDAISVYRNAADHGIENTIMKSWKIESDATIEAILLALTTIRSIYTFVQRKDLLI